MAVTGFYFIVIILLNIQVISGLEVCEDHYVSCSSSNCGVYPLQLLYRIHCMKTCGVCTDVNRALGKPTSQSSTSGFSVSNRAVDGNPSGNSCTKTNNSNHSPQWWCTDLQQIYHIDTIKIYINQNNMHGFQIKLGLSGNCDKTGYGLATACYTDGNKTHRSVSTITGCNHGSLAPLVGRFVFISIGERGIRNPPPLSLCEVGIFTGTKCSAGYYSFNTTTCLPCDTCKEASCEVDTGMCWDGCTNGYQGEMCSECTIGRYGPTCRLACNTTRCRGNCDRKTGTCSQCAPGYHGTNCQLPCNTDCIYGICIQVDGSCLTEKVKEKIDSPVEHHDEQIERSLVGIIGVMVGIVVTLCGFTIRHLILKRRKSYKLKNPSSPIPPSRQDLDPMNGTYYVPNNQSAMSSRYIEISAPDCGNTQIQCFLNKEMCRQISEQSEYLKRPPIELPGNEKQGLKRQNDCSNPSTTYGKSVKYQDDSFDLDNSSLYTAVKI